MSGHFAAVFSPKPHPSLEAHKDALLSCFLHNFGPNYRSASLSGHGHVIFPADEAPDKSEDDILLALAGSPFFERIEPVEAVRRRSIDSYRRDGMGFVKALNGIFSGILLDPGIPGIRIFNDRLGIHPLYVSSALDATLFSTSALAMARAMKSSLDRIGVIQFLGLRTLVGSRTLFTGVERVPPATQMSLDGSGRRIVTYWDAKSRLDRKPLSAAALDDVALVFNQSVKRRIPEDGIVGTGLTGGLDTRAILSSLVLAGASVRAFTITGPDPDPEFRIVSRLVRETGIAHRFFIPERDVPGTFFENLETFTREFDGEVPGLVFYHSIPAYLQQSRHSPVLFAGTGGEIFRGEHYRIGYNKRRIEKSLVDHLANKLIYKRGLFNDLFRAPESKAILRESIAEELKACSCGNPWSTLDLFHLRNDVRRHGGGGLGTMSRYVGAGVPFLDNEFVDLGLKFGSYDNNRSPFHAHIIEKNLAQLTRIPRRTDFGGALKILPPSAETFRIRNYMNLIRRLPVYLALHEFSIFGDKFGYRNLLVKNLDDFDRAFGKNRLVSTPYYQGRALSEVLRGETKNGFLHYYELGYLLTIELLARFLKGEKPEGKMNPPGTPGARAD